MTRAVLTQAHSKNIDQSISGFSYVGNAPVFKSKTSATLGTGATTALGHAHCDEFIIGVQAKVTTAVAGGDSKLTLVVAGTDVEFEMIVPEGTGEGEVLRWDLTELDLVAGAGETVGVKNDAVPSAGVAHITLVASPL